MHTELKETGKTEIPQRRIFLKRLLLNVVWLLALVVVSFIYDQLQLNYHFFIYIVHWYKSFLIAYIPLLIIQGILHWFTLKHFYPQKRVGNILWVSVMSIMFIISYWLMVGILFVLAVRSGALS